MKPGEAVSGRCGDGVVARAIEKVLGDTDESMKLPEIQRNVEATLRRTASKESIKWSLRVGSRRNPPQFERVAHGRYRSA